MLPTSCILCGDADADRGLLGVPKGEETLVLPHLQVGQPTALSGLDSRD